MKISILITISIILIGCSNAMERNTSTSNNFEPTKYFELINQAELSICEEQFKVAIEKYKLAFSKIEKPFGKDIFNAALASQLNNQKVERNKYLQEIINNSDDLDFVKSVFINKYISEKEWQNLVTKQKVSYNAVLRKEMKEINDRDQLFRPMYETHDDTIEANRKINLNRIIKLSETSGLPSHIELGYTNKLRGQQQDIVLYHTAQRRSREKTVMDLEEMLYQGVQEGRFDPETAILYLNFQNDSEKGIFEVYSTWQYNHPLLPDSLNNKVWLPNLDEKQQLDANFIRKKWHANSLEDIAKKSNYLSNSKLPFIFTCVRTSIANLKEDMDKETALEQYQMMTSFRKEYK